MILARRDEKARLPVAIRLAAIALTSCVLASPVGASAVSVALPNGVITEKILEGIVWKGLDIRLVQLRIPMSVQGFLERLSSEVPDGATFSITDGIASVQWEQGVESILLQVAAVDEGSAVGALSSVRASPEQVVASQDGQHRADADGRLARNSHCRDIAAALQGADGQAEPIFDLRDSGPADGRFIKRGASARMRAFLADPGIDATVARIRHKMPRDGWVLRTQHAVHRPDRSVSLVAICGTREARLDVARLRGRTMIVMTEVESP